ncbi:hypothetical protein GCM10027168_64590 [Streptomyces capparidis]
MADEPHGSNGQGRQPDVHYAPTQAWQGPSTPPPPPPPPSASGQQPPPPPPPAGQPGPPPAAPPQQPGVHYAPTQAWQGPATPPQPGPAAPPPPPPAAPQAPGGYGYPQQPQPPSGYGYPQPAPPPAYGQPGPQPGPQGWGTGYPQQPGYPMPPTPGGGGGRKNGLIIGIIGGAVAIAVAAAGIVWATSGGDDKQAGKKGGTTGGQSQTGGTNGGGGEKPTLTAGSFDLGSDRTVLWKVDAKKANGDDSLATAIGHWFAGGNFVFGDETGITAYDLKTGQEKWTAQAPENGAKPCAMSEEVGDDGKAAVLYRPAKAESYAPCTLLAVLDTATGKKVWSHNLRPGAESGRGDSVSVDAKNNRVFAITAEMVFSYSLDTGKKNWDAGGDEDCDLSGRTAPTAIVVEQTCFDEDKTVIHSLNLDDGRKSLWTADAPGDYSTDVAVLSASPAVTLINEGSAAARGYVNGYSDNGTPNPKIKMAQSFGNLPEADGLFDTAPRYRFSGTTMIATVGKGSTGRNTTVAAFDLTTGQEKWHKQVGDAENAAQVLGFEGDSLVAARGGGYSGEGKLLGIALSDGTVTEGGDLPKNTVGTLEYNELVHHENLLVLSQRFASTYQPRIIGLMPE